MVDHVGLVNDVVDVDAVVDLVDGIAGVDVIVCIVVELS